MSNLSDFVGGGGGLKPFNNLGTVTGTVNLDVSEFGSFRVKQGAGAITLNVTGKAADTAGYVELFFYPNAEQAVTISGADLVDNGYTAATGIITILNYNNVSFSVNAQDTQPFGITFNNDGLKMYMVGNTNRVYQYTLSTPFNVSTASHDYISFDVSGQDINLFGITFNNDGSNMYMVGFDSKTVFQYTLSTPFNVSTASYDNVSFDVSGQDTAPVNITFNNDGSNMYMVGFDSKTVFQYTHVYDFGPLFQYQIIHTGTAATFNTLNSDYTIEVAT